VIGREIEGALIALVIPQSSFFIGLVNLPTGSMALIGKRNVINKKEKCRCLRQGGCSKNILRFLLLMLFYWCYCDGLIKSNAVVTYDELIDQSDQGETSTGQIALQAGGATFPQTFYQDALFGYQFVDPNVDQTVCSCIFVQTLRRET
jgi:hypothetical protein